MIYTILIPILYLLTDSLAWRYYTHGPILYGELAKLSALILLAVTAYAGYLFTANPHWQYIVSLILFHFVIQQIGCGVIRQGNPLYLGVGWFDRFIRFITGGTWYMYVLLLALATFIGIHLLLNVN